MRIVLIPAARPIVCPACESAISWRRVRGRLIVCPSCGSYVQLGLGYFRTLKWLAILICLTGAYFSGSHSDAILIVPLLLILPTAFVLLFVTIRLFPPTLEPSDDFRAVLYGVDPAATESEETGDTVAAPVQEVGGHERLSGIRSAFRDIARPNGDWSVEGAVIVGVAIVVTVFMTYQIAVLPIVYSVFPGYDSTRTGPSGFPVTLHIGADAIDISNGSTARWTCTIEVGAVAHYVAGINIESAGSVSVPDGSFTPSVGRAVLRPAARDKIVLTCDEPSGVSHFAIWP